MCKLKEGIFSNGKDYYKKEFNNTDSETIRILKCEDCGNNYIEVIYKEDVTGYRYTNKECHYGCDCNLLKEYKDYSKKELLYIIKDYEQQIKNKDKEINKIKNKLKTFTNIIRNLNFIIKDFISMED